MNYQPFCTHYAATSYKPRKLSRPLRQGAQVISHLKVCWSHFHTKSHPIFLQLFDYFCLNILYQKAYYTLTTFDVFFKDELIQVVAPPVGQLNLVSERMDFPKPSPEEAAERDISLLKLVPPQALVYPTESNPLRIFVSRSWLSQRT